MEIKKIEVGYLQTNCYIVIKDNECLIIDPGDEIYKIINNIKNKPIAILITHYHSDHVGALNELKEKFNVPVYDYNNVGINKVSSFEFNVIETKGHHNTCVSFYFEKDEIMFVGDFIFKGDIGRTDLEYGDEKEMLKSLNSLKKFNKNIILYPGHGDKTTIGNEF